MKNTLFITLVLYAMLFVISACEDIGAPTNAEFTLPTVQLRIGCPITVSNTSTYLDNYEWNFGDGNTSIDRSPTHTYTTPGTYTVTLRVYDADTEDTHSVTVVVSAESSKFELIEEETRLVYGVFMSSVAPAYDGGYVTVVTDEPNINGYGVPVTMLKTTVNGQISWKKYLDLPNSYIQMRDITPTLDQGHLMVGGTIYEESPGDPTTSNNFWKSFMVKINEKGDTLWTKYLGGEINKSELLYAISAIPGGYVMAGEVNDSEQNNQDVLLYRTDTDGNIKWRKTFGAGNRCEGAYALTLAPDGGYVMVGYTRQQEPQASPTSIYLLKTDPDGNLQWNNTLGSIGWDGDIVTASNGGYVIMTSGGLVKTHAGGSMHWEKTFGGELNSITPAPDGGYVMTGRNFVSTYNSNVYLVKIDANGNQVWEENFEGGFLGEGEDVQATYDCGYIITGKRDFEYIYLIKTDENGKIN